MTGTIAPSTIMLASLESFAPVMMGHGDWLALLVCSLLTPSQDVRIASFAPKDYHVLAERIARESSGLARSGWPDQDKGGS